MGEGWGEGALGSPQTLVFPHPSVARHRRGVRPEGEGTKPPLPLGEGWGEGGFLAPFNAGAWGSLRRQRLPKPPKRLKGGRVLVAPLP